LTTKHPSTIRVLDDTPVIVWSHWIRSGHPKFPKVNAGKGMSFICSGWGCTICEHNKNEVDPNNKSENHKLFYARVLDRTLVRKCECGKYYFEVNKWYPDKCECGADLSTKVPEPLNEVKILQKAASEDARSILGQLIRFEDVMKLGSVTNYDIKVTATLPLGGSKDNINYMLIPRPEEKLDISSILGVDWSSKILPLSEVTKPLPSYMVNKILDGEDYYNVAK
jgi:hypothetical protein